MIKKLIEEESYEDALRHLQNPINEEEMFYKITCLFGLKRFAEARYCCESILDKVDKFHYEILSLYLDILLEVGEDDKVLLLLEEELSMPYLPSEYLGAFEALYDSILSARQIEGKGQSAFDKLTDEELKESLLSTKDLPILLSLLQQIDKRNVRLFMDIMKQLLLEEEVSRIAKTVILEILTNQEINQEITMKNKGNLISVNPCRLTPVFKQAAYFSIMDVIETKTGDKDISFLYYCEDVLMAYLGNIYPEMIDVNETNVFAAAIVLYVNELQMLPELDIEEICALYGINEDKMIAVYEEIANNQDM